MSSSVGSVFPSVLTVLFIGLKLTGLISWSWWWVLSPMWIGAALAACLLAIYVMFVRR